MKESNKYANELEYPHLRSVNAIPVDVQGTSFVMLKDAQGISQKSVVLPLKTFYLVSNFNGKNSIRDIQVKYVKQFGELILSDEIRDIVRKLDDALLLESEKFRQHKKNLEEKFKKEKVRPCILCGNEYPKDSSSFVKFMDKMFKDAVESKLPPPIRIISPHIDFKRGKDVYVASYNELKKCVCSTFVIFGTSHQPMKNMFSLTYKSFQTPLGEVKTNREIVEKIGSMCKTNFFEDEIRHKWEHSIEFQVVLLKYIFPNTPFTIVPILVNYIDDLKESKSKGEQIEDFLHAFERAVYGVEVTFIAGADLSHIGPFFGDARVPTTKEMEDLQSEEIKYLTYLENGQVEDFFEYVYKRQKRLRICGFAPIYIMMKAMKPKKGKIIKYKQCSDLNRYNNVTISALTFYR